MIPTDELLTGSVTELARKYGVARSTIWSRQLRARCADTPGFEKVNRDEDIERLAHEDLSDNELADLVQSLSENILGNRVTTEAIEVRLSATEPVAVAFTGDWHIGNAGTDYRALRSDLNKLARTDGLYVFGMGDYIDNYKANMGRAAEGMYDAVLADPEQQRRLAVREMKKIRYKMIGAVLGCHLDWDRKVGIDTLQMLLDKLDMSEPIPNMAYGGAVKLHVGEQTYSGLVRHKYKDGGAVNTTNAHRRASTEYPVSGLWDFVALAHLHFNDLQVHSVAGREQVWLRSGSYKVLDRYGQRIGGYEGEPGIPVLIFDPVRHRILPFYGTRLDEALETLKLIRAGRFPGWSNS